MRPNGTPQQLEKRRRNAVRLLRSVKCLSEVARRMHASVSSIFRWQQAFLEGGDRGLNAKPIPGRPANLSKHQKTRLIHGLLKGPRAAGYPTQLWTLKRIRQFIQRKFHVRYHPGHVWKLLTQLGWSCQKPVRRALPRDERAIAHWKRFVWPQIKKKLTAWALI